MTIIDLISISKNLLEENVNIKNFLSTNKQPLTITADKLSPKYNELKTLEKTPLIKFIPTENNPLIKVLYLANHDNELSIFDCEDNLLANWMINKYKLSEILSTATITNNKITFIIDCRISKKAKSRLLKSDIGIIEGKGKPDLELIEEKVIFIPIKKLDFGDYKIINIHHKKTKKFNDLLIDVENIKTNEIIKYVAINTRLSELVIKYNLDTKFSITEHQNYINEDNIEVTKVIIKDLNFKEDLSNLQLF